LFCALFSYLKKKKKTKTEGKCEKVTEIKTAFSLALAGRGAHRAGLLYSPHRGIAILFSDLRAPVGTLADCDTDTNHSTFKKAVSFRNTTNSKILLFFKNRFSL
jgi:hypothetical protein